MSGAISLDHDEMIADGIKSVGVHSGSRRSFVRCRSQFLIEDMKPEALTCTYFVCSLRHPKKEATAFDPKMIGFSQFPTLR